MNTSEKLIHVKVPVRRLDIILLIVRSLAKSRLVRIKVKSLVGCEKNGRGEAGWLGSSSEKEEERNGCRVSLRMRIRTSSAMTHPTRRRGSPS